MPTRLLFAALVALPLPARAIPWSTLGGQPLPSGTTVGSFGFGFPAMRAAYAQGLSVNLDGGARFGYDYLLGAADLAGTLRWRAAELGSGDLSIDGALGAYGSLGLRFYDAKNTDDAGMILGLGTAFSFPLRESAILAATLRVPAAWTFGRGGGAIVPILFGAAVDVAIAEKVNVGATLQLGPRYDAPGERIPRWRLWVEGQLWTSVRMF